MNGPAHYAQASVLLSRVDLEPSSVEARLLVARAGVHAQLAAIAVVALQADGLMPDEDFAAWDAVAGVPPAEEPPAAGPRPGPPLELVDHLDHLPEH
jgi:hypothetical protein